MSNRFIGGDNTVGCDHLLRIDWLKQTIAIYLSLDALHEDVATEIDKGVPAAAGFAARDDGQALFWMYFDKKPRLNSIVHEAVHIVDFVLERVGIPISVEVTEVRAYLTEWLVSELCQRLKVTRT